MSNSPFFPDDLGFEGDRVVPAVDFIYPGEQSNHEVPTTTPLQAAALRFACHLEPRSMAEVSDELGVSQQALSDMIARIHQRLGFRRTRKKRTVAA